MSDHIQPPKRKAVPPRPLTMRERDLITEILASNPAWADVDVAGTRVVAQCDCGECETVYLDSDAPQNPSRGGTVGYIGRTAITTRDGFGITVTLDQRDGKLDELYIDFVDLNAPGNRPLPKDWQEVVRTTEPM